MVMPRTIVESIGNEEGLSTKISKSSEEDNGNTKCYWKSFGDNIFPAWNINCFLFYWKRDNETLFMPTSPLLHNGEWWSLVSYMGKWFSFLSFLFFILFLWSWVFDLYQLYWYDQRIFSSHGRFLLNWSFSQSFAIW